MGCRCTGEGKGTCWSWGDTKLLEEEISRKGQEKIFKKHPFPTSSGQHPRIPTSASHLTHLLIPESIIFYLLLDPFCYHDKNACELTKTQGSHVMDKSCQPQQVLLCIHILFKNKLNFVSIHQRYLCKKTSSITKVLKQFSGFKFKEVIPNHGRSG